MGASRHSTERGQDAAGEAGAANWRGQEMDDARALTSLYLRHAHRVARVVYRVIGDDRDLDDVVQETFLHAAARVTALRDPAAVEAWLVTIAVRRARRLLRRRRLRQGLLGLWAREAPAPVRPEGASIAAELGRALARLSPDLRIPWVLHRVEGMPLPETAGACGVSLATIKRRIARAEALLRGGLP